MRRTLLVLLVALGLFATATPANAGAALEWTDPQGDGQLVVDAALPTVPVPNEPSLDVTKVRIEQKGDAVVWTLDIAKLGATNPSGSTGIVYQISWAYGAGSYRIQVIDDVIWGKATEFRGGTTGSLGPVDCGRCIGRIDRKASKVVWTTPISSLSRAMKAADPSAKALGAGAKFETIVVLSNRSYTVGAPGVPIVRFTPTADRAATDKAFII